MLSSDRTQIRSFFRDAWRKHRDGEPLSPMEAVVSDVIAAHPEYHALLQNPDANLNREYRAEEGTANPFLHMGLHIALREQLAADRPKELRAIYQRLLARFGDAHEAEHQVIECIAKLLADAQHSGGLVDDRDYVECLRRLL